MLSKIILLFAMLFILISCNGGDIAPEDEITPVSESELSDKSPSEIKSYLEAKYRDKCTEEIIDGEIFESVFYKKNDASCTPELRSAYCENGELVVTGNEEHTELSCSFKPEDNQNQAICRKGKVLKIGIDRNDDGIVDDYVGDVLSYKGDMGAADNFNYYSWSAHPLNGISPKGYAHHIYFYEGHDGLSLQFYYNVDAGGSANNKVNVELDIFDNELDDRVILSDDRGEIKQQVVSENHKKYLGKYHYWYNTDGGVIGPLGGEQFRIVLRPKDYGDISESKFYSADGNIINLMTDDQDYAYIIEYKEEEICEDGSNVQCEDVNSNYLKDSSFEGHELLSEEEILSGKSKWDVLKEIGAWKSYDKARSGIEVQVSNRAYAGLQAVDGHAKVELDAHKKNGFAKSHTHMYQDFTVEKDKNYSLSFFHSARVSSDSNRFKVKLSKRVDGVLSRVFEKTYNNRVQSWRESRLNFQADQAHYRVEFMGVGHENSYGAYIDNVRVFNSDYFLLSDDERAQCSDQPVDDPDPTDGDGDGDGDGQGDPDVDPVILDPITFIKPSEAQLLNQLFIDVEGSCYEGATVYLSGDIQDQSFLCEGQKFSGIVELSSSQGLKKIDGYQQFGESISQSAQVNFRFDNKIPTVSINQIEDINFLTVKNVKVQGACSENGRLVSILIEGLSFSSSCLNLEWKLENIDLSSLVDGEVKVLANHDDLAGNQALQVSTTFNKDTRAERPIANFSIKSFLYPSVSLNSSSSQVQGAGSEIVKRSWGVIDSLSFESVDFIDGNISEVAFTFPKDCAKYQVCLVVEDNLGLESAPYCQSFESPRENIELAISKAGSMAMTWDMFDGQTVDINWGDESLSENVSGEVTHFYQEPANRNIEVTFCAAAVKKLNLSRSSDEPSISGIMPNLSKLTKVEDVNLAGNDINGEIPSSHFPSSPNLINFDISENKLSGSLSEDLFIQNINIERLDFKFNELSGVLPAKIFENNKKLESIEFQRNKISGSLDKNLFKGLSLLKFLELDNNQLSGGLDEQLFQETVKLERLSLNHNNLDGNIEGKLFEKTLELANINLSDNQLSGSLPGNLFSFNSNINGINLARNKLVGNIPTELFGNNPLLGALYLNNNQFSGELNPNLFANNAIMTLIDLSFNELSGSLDGGLFSANIELSNLNLANNQVQGEIPALLFSSNSKLERINFENNSFSDFENRDIFNNNIKLKSFDISNNQLVSSTSFLANSELRFLDISSNSLVQNDLDNIIIELVSVGGSNGEVSLQGQSSGAAPNPQASIFIDMLIARGWSVLVDLE